MFKTKTVSFWRIATIVLAALGLMILGLVFGPATASQETMAGTLSNPMSLGTSIAGATVNFVGGSATAEYTGQSQYPFVQSVVVGTDELDADDYTLVFKRNGEVTDDYTSAGQIDIIITGQGAYEGSIDTAFTITKKSVKVNFSFDQAIANDTVAYEYNGAFVTDLSNQGLSGNFGMITTYYNKTLDQFTEGFVAAGDYVVTINITNPNYTVVGSNSTNIYVRPVVLSNADGSILVKNIKGFAKGITLGEASFTVNEYAIKARTDITSQFSKVALMINLALLKNGQPYTSTDDLQIIAKVGDMNFDNLSLYNNKGNTTKFQKIAYDEANGTITFESKVTPDPDNEGAYLPAYLGTYVLVEGAQADIFHIILISLTAAAIMALGIVSIWLLCTRKTK